MSEERKRERKEAGRRGTRIQGAVRNLALAAGTAAAAAHGRCTAPLRAADDKQQNFHCHTPISVFYLSLFYLLSLLPSLHFYHRLISSHSPSTLHTDTTFHKDTYTAYVVPSAHTCSYVTLSSSGDHTEFKVGAANRLIQPGWSIFLLPCNPLA